MGGETAVSQGKVRWDYYQKKMEIEPPKKLENGALLGGHIFSLS